MLRCHLRYVDVIVVDRIIVVDVVVIVVVIVSCGGVGRSVDYDERDDVRRRVVVVVVVVVVLVGFLPPRSKLSF